MGKIYGCIVIGGGHAGVEAALLCARMGVSTVMVNFTFDTIGLMSCNPAIGGVGKGQLVREVDILGGEMGCAADRTGIQFRQLNAGKGQAVRSSRVQADRTLYKQYMQKRVLEQDGLEFCPGEVETLESAGGRITGVRLSGGNLLLASQVIVTAGTFLNGRLHVGPSITPGGRIYEPPSMKLAESLESLGFTLRNFKTGTPPRLDGRTVDYACMQRQDSDNPPLPFSFRTKAIASDRCLLPCWITRTTEHTHEIIRKNFHLSPMYSGQIDATGVRYCPSIEDKLKKFGERESHHVFLEPDGIDTPVIYPNGVSTGLPAAVQEAFIRTIPGLERAEFVQYGYSIEHAVIDARELAPTLESRRVRGLFFAGQVNGTTGYEEAAAQGAMAGINAALRHKGELPFVLGRDEAYAGVLIDDLVTKGTNEPYRMFTSRVEHRLLVREDNTDERLARHAFRLGLMSGSEFAAINRKYEQVQRTRSRLREVAVSAQELNPILVSAGSAVVTRKSALEDILRRPSIFWNQLVGLDPQLQEVDAAVAARVEYDVKYEGFIDRQKKELEKFRHLENIRIPEDFDYAAVHSISHEVRQKLEAQRPQTLGQAQRISGVTPAAIAVLMISLKKYFDLHRKEE